MQPEHCLCQVFSYHGNILRSESRPVKEFFARLFDRFCPKRVRQSQSGCRQSGSLSLAMTFKSLPWKHASSCEQTQISAEQNWVISPTSLLFQLSIKLIMVRNHGNDKFALLLLLKYPISRSTLFLSLWKQRKKKLLGIREIIELAKICWSSRNQV